MIAVAQLDRLVVADQLVPALRAAMEKEGLFQCFRGSLVAGCVCVW